MPGKKLIIERMDDADRTRLSLKGIIDEEADFSQAFADLKPNVVINLEGIELINSCGVREWIHAIQKFGPRSRVQYDKCATRIVEQINYVANFLGTGEVTSFFAPYFCPKCKAESNILLDAKELSKNRPVRAPAQKCPTCKGPLEFDDIEEEYFSFLEQS